MILLYFLYIALRCILSCNFSSHQRVHLSFTFILLFLEHSNAFANSGLFCNVPKARNWPGLEKISMRLWMERNFVYYLWGFVKTWTIRLSGRVLVHQVRANETKNNCSGVRSKPGSLGSIFLLSDFDNLERCFCHAFHAAYSCQKKVNGILLLGPHCPLYSRLP